MDEADPWYSEKKLFSSGVVSPEEPLFKAFASRKKRPPLPFVSQKSMLSPAGKRSVRSSKFSDGPQLGIVLEREERSGQRRTLSSPCADPFFSACQSCLVARLSTQAPHLFLSTKLPACDFTSMQNTLA